MALSARMPDDQALIFTETVDFAALGEKPLWETEPETLALLATLPHGKRWLNLAAGDGRYTPELLDHSAHVVVADIDAAALATLLRRLPAEKQQRVDCAILHMAQSLPFHTGSFDGVLCTGVLHLFPEEHVRAIVSEIRRVTRPGGDIVCDFATDTRRQDRAGTLVRQEWQHTYTLDSAQMLFRELFANELVATQSATWRDDLRDLPEIGLLSEGTFLLVHAQRAR